MKNLIILGGSGIGMIAISIARELGIYNIKGFLNDMVPVGEKIGKYEKYPVIGKTSDLRMFLEDENNMFFIAYVGMQQEELVFNKIEYVCIKKENLDGDLNKLKSHLEKIMNIRKSFIMKN